MNYRICLILKAGERAISKVNVGSLTTASVTLHTNGREFGVDPATRPETQINKITQLRTQNTKTVYKNQIKATTKLTLKIKLVMYSNTCLVFNLIPDLSCSNDYGVPCKLAQATRSSRPLLCDVTLAVMNLSQTNT